MTTLDLSPSVFSILSGLIEEKCGLHYGLLDRELLQEKSSVRAQEAGFESMLDYYYYLRYDEGGEKEFQTLLESLVVNETYFFREWPAVETLVDHFLVPWCARGMRPRIWSAACASGEEPLSLAMLLEDRGILNRVEIVASDISEKVLTKARGGRYGRRSVRTVPRPHLLERHVRAAEENTYVVSKALTDAIQWRQCNLLDVDSVSHLGHFDVILCRNVLIYFSEITIRKVLGDFARALKPDGVLLVGVSESLLRYGNVFVGEEQHGSFVYRKPSIKALDHATEKVPTLSLAGTAAELTAKSLIKPSASL